MSSAHVVCVVEASACIKCGATVKECVEANVADYELEKPAAHSRARCESGRESCHARLVPLLACHKIEHPPLRSTNPSTRAIAGRASPALTLMLASTSLLQTNRSSAQRQRLESSSFWSDVDQSVPETSQRRLPIAQDAAAPFLITFFVNLWYEDAGPTSLETFSERGCSSRSTGWARQSVLRRWSWPFLWT